MTWPWKGITEALDRLTAEVRTLRTELANLRVTLQLLAEHGSDLTGSRRS